MPLDEEKWNAILQQWEGDEPGVSDVETPPASDAPEGMMMPTLDVSEPDADQSGGPSDGDADNAEPAPAAAPLRLRAPTSPATAGAGQKGLQPTPMQAEPAASLPPPESLDWKGLSDRLANAQRGASTSRAAEQMFANIVPGYRTDPGRFEGQVKAAEQPLAMAKERQAYEGRDLAQKAQAGALKAKAAMDDPNSLQSQKAREAIKAFFGDMKLPAGFDGWSANDVQKFASSGTLDRVADNQRASAAKAAAAQAAADKSAKGDAELAQMRKTWAGEFKKAGIDPNTATKFDLERMLQMRGQNLTAEALQHREGEVERKKTEGIPANMELTEGANPAPEQLKDLGTVDRGADEVHQLANRMREVLARSSKLGRAMPGDDRRQLTQLQGEMTLALKDAGKLGQISAGDQALIDSIRPDATGVEALIRDYGSFDKQLQGMERYADDKRTAAMKSMGARHKDGGGAGGAVKMSNGKETRMVPRRHVEAARADGYSEAQ